MKDTILDMGLVCKSDYRLLVVATDVDEEDDAEIE